ncbi:MAG: hypothetical protein V3T22_05330 [Planctomycetota bacterium]
MSRVTSEDVFEFIASLAAPRRDEEGIDRPGFLGGKDLAACLHAAAHMSKEEIAAEENAKQREFASAEHDKEIAARGTGPAPVGQYN